MLVTRENERLCLNNWGYNSSRIISALAVIVENNGGVVKPTKKAIISNRTIENAKRDIIEKLEQVKEAQENNPTEKRAAYIERNENELKELETINNEPITVTHTTYISFVLDGMYYYYQTDNNPFFEFYYKKTPVVNKKYSLDSLMMYDKKEWLFDCFFSFRATDDDVKEAANLIFNMLVSSKNSTIQRESRRKRVANVYDGGYHYETVYSSERFEQIGEWYKC